MSGKPINALVVGKWSLGYSKSHNMALMMLEFADAKPLSLAIPIAEAQKLAEAILEQMSMQVRSH